MRIGLSDERQRFAATLHELLTAADVPAAASCWAARNHGPGLDIWRRLADVGVTALAVPERWGGLGAHPIDVVIACEELGHHAVPGPVAETLAAVPALLAALGGDVADRWLPGLADGTLLATLAAPPLVPYAVDADAAALILRAAPDGLRLGEPGTPHASVDETRRLFELSPGAALAVGAEADPAHDRAVEFGTLACAAQLLGGGRAMLELAADYARQRIQFGRPIGQFQAVKHRLADVAIGLEFARPLLYAAAVAVGENAPTVARDISAAKVACAEAADCAARAALQVHGAIGYSQEYELSRYLTRVRALLPAWGTRAEHRGRVMAALTAGAV